ncbi:hypothetical protein C0J52_12332 [Blattella germanica]|nr:hypothetical protein C0J52_12332 [Blattella germanica]
MADTIFDIFGTKSRAHTGISHQGFNSSDNTLKGEVENIKVTGKGKIEPCIRKQALGDVGNTLQNKTVLKDSKIKQSYSNVESTFLKLPSKSPIRKVKNVEGTPNIKPILRTPLSDITRKLKKEEFQQKPIINTELKYCFLQDFDNFIGGTNFDLPIWAFDKGKHCEDLNFSVSVIYRAIKQHRETGLYKRRQGQGFTEQVFDTENLEPFTIPVVSDDEL